MSWEPIWVASRMRCDSPPESVAGGAVERQVAEPDVVEEPQPLADLLQDLAGDEPLALARGQRVQRLRARRAPRARVQRVDVPVADPHRQALGLEARPAAGRAGLRAHELLDPGPHVLRLRLAVAPQQVGDHPLEARCASGHRPRSPVCRTSTSSSAAAVEEHLPRLARAASRTGCSSEKPYFFATACRIDPCQPASASPQTASAPCPTGSVGVGHHQLLVELQQAPEPLAVGQAP